MSNALKSYLHAMANPDTFGRSIERGQQLALNRRLAQQRRERLGLEERRQDWTEGGDAELRRMNARNYAGRTDAQNRRTALQEDQFGFKQRKYDEAPKRAAVMGGVETLTKNPEGLAHLPTENLEDPGAYRAAAPNVLRGQVRQKARIAGAETTARESAQTRAMVDRAQNDVLQNREISENDRLRAIHDRQVLTALIRSYGSVLADPLAAERVDPNIKALMDQLALRTFGKAANELTPADLQSLNSPTPQSTPQPAPVTPASSPQKSLEERVSELEAQGVPPEEAAQILVNEGYRL